MTIFSTQFKSLIGARIFFTLANQMQAVVMGWLVYDLTRDPFALGLVGLAEAVPALSLALFAGYFIDQSNPAKVYRTVLLGTLGSSLILLLTTQYQAQIGLRGHVMALYFASMVTGTARAFSQPSMFSLIPKLVPREKLGAASAWMTSSMQTARIAGPALGGLIFGFFNSKAAFLTISCCILVSIVLSFQIRIEDSFQKKPTKKKFKTSELVSGALFVFRHPILFPALNLDMISVMFGGVTALLPIFAKEILQVGPQELGLLRAAPALGAILMSLYLTRAPFKTRAGTWLLSSVAGFGFSILIFAFSKSFFLSVACLALSGFFDSASMVIRNTAVQLASPEHLRGRISAVNSMFIGSSNELGEFESGIAAKFLGPISAAYFGAIVCLVTVSWITLTSPKLRKLNLEQI